MKKIFATIHAAAAILVLSGSFALAQGPGGYPPGVNPSNPQDLTNRSNPQDLTVPGGSNPQDLVRAPALPRAISPLPHSDPGRSSALSLSLGHTYTVKPVKKLRRKHGVTRVEGQ